MVTPISIINSTPLFSAPTKGFFDSIVDQIKWVIFPQAMEDEQKERLEMEKKLLSSTAKWRSYQNYRIPAESKDPPLEEVSYDEIEIFFRDFFSNLTIQYFEVTVIEQIKNGISKGLSHTLKNHADTIVKFIVNDEADLDIEPQNVQEVIDKAIVYLFQVCRDPLEKEEVINSALLACNCSLTEHHFNMLLSKGCSIVMISTYVGPSHVKPLLKAIGRELVPRMLKSDLFLHNFSDAVYETVRPFLENTLDMPKGPLQEVSNVSPIIKVFSNLASLLVSKRLTLLYRSMDLKNMFDEAITNAFKHVQAHSAAVNERDKIRDRHDPIGYYLSAFASKEGCHPVARALLTPNYKSAHLDVRNYLEEVSTSLIDYIFDSKTVEIFVTNLRKHRTQLEVENKDNALVLRLVNNLCDPANANSINNMILKLKPLAINGLAKGIAIVGFKKIFPHQLIYQFLYESIAPPLYDLIRKGLVKKIISRKLKETIGAFVLMYPQFVSNPKNVNFDQITTILEKYYRAEFKKPIPEDVKRQIPEGVRDLLYILKSQEYVPGIGDDYEKRLRDYFNSAYKSDKVQVYGQLLMHVIFGVSKGGILPWVAWLKDNSILTDFFRDIFLDGMVHLRGVDNEGKKIPGYDPNQTLFNLIKDAILPYRDPKEVQNFLQNESKPWDDPTIESRTKEQAKILSDLLADLIRLSTPLAGGPLSNGVKAIDLQGHLEYALTALFQNDHVNNSLFFRMLEVLNNEIKRQNGYPDSV